MKQIRIVTTQHPRYSHEVIAPPRLFGKRIRKSFTSRDAARVEKQKLENKLAKAELAPLERDVHLLAARYQEAA